MADAFVNCSIKDMLCNQFNVAPDYLSERISTIFLNGKPVDSVETAIIQDGDVLALSGAMPGLVGATFRKGGALSIFRSSITHRSNEDQIDKPVKGMITLKLFNLLVPEMGHLFLEKGLRITAGDLCDAFLDKKNNLQSVLNSIYKDSAEIDMDTLFKILKDLSTKEFIRLRVKVL